MPTPEELQLEYQIRFSAHDQYRVQVWSVLCNDFFARYISPDDAVLDLGAGWGEFINQIPASQKYAMDLNPETGLRINDDVTFFQQDCSTPWQLPENSLDVVFTSNFLEHLPDKRSAVHTMEQAIRALKPNGRMICLGPNIAVLGGAYWDFWDHHIALSHHSIAELLTLSGFDIQYQCARFLPYSMSQGFKPPLFMLKFYLKIPIVWRFFGHQFLVIAQRPSASE